MNRAAWHKTEYPQILGELLNNTVLQKAFEVLRAEAEPALSADATLNPTVAAANYHQRAGYYKALNDLIGLKNPPPKQKNTQVPLLATSLD